MSTTESDGFETVYPNLETPRYHPDYGYPQSKRDAAMKDAEIIGIITSAAVHKVSLSALYKWIRESKQ